MKVIFFMAILLSGSLALGAALQSEKVTITPVVTVEDAQMCGQSKGRGAMIFTIDEEGSPTSRPAAYCVR